MPTRRVISLPPLRAQPASRRVAWLHRGRSVAPESGRPDPPRPTSPARCPAGWPAGQTHSKTLAPGRAVPVACSRQSGARSASARPDAASPPAGRAKKPAASCARSRSARPGSALAARGWRRSGQYAPCAAAAPAWWSPKPAPPGLPQNPWQSPPAACSGGRRCKPDRPPPAWWARHPCHPGWRPHHRHAPARPRRYPAKHRRAAARQTRGPAAAHRPPPAGLRPAPRSAWQRPRQRGRQPGIARGLRRTKSQPPRRSDLVQ